MLGAVVSYGRLLYNNRIMTKGADLPIILFVQSIQTSWLISTPFVYANFLSISIDYLIDIKFAVWIQLPYTTAYIYKYLPLF